jgi:hypothetical protein
MKKFVATLLILGLFAMTGLAQVTTGRIEGTVTDPLGAAVPGAQVKVLNKATGLTLETTADERGGWVFPSMATATYTVTVNHPGFKTSTIDNVKVDAGVPSTVNAKLEVGSLAETVEVQGGAEILQTQSATVTSTLVGRQLHDLPFTSRNLTELIVTQPGSATPGVPRSTSVYGLPQSALNVTLDGINIQDNSNKSSDGFFNAIFPRADAIEEMSVTGAAAGADSNAEGAMQVKMVTRSGTNAWHGGLFEQHRNQSLNANSYFNNLNKTAPRDHLVFNQFGGMVGGPIKHNKLFFFAHMEAFQLPQTYTEPTGTVLTKEARSGIFRYPGNTVGVDLFKLAAANGFPSTPDPIIAKTLDQIGALTDGVQGLKSRVGTNADYNRNNLDFQSKGGNYRRFPTIKFDYNLTDKHHVEVVYNYQTNIRRPDGVNVGTASPIFPGTGNVLNGTEFGNQGGIAFSAVAALRSTLTSRLVSELRFGLIGGTVIFNNGINPSDFDQWRGYAPGLGFVTNPFRTTGQTRRNTPLKQGNANLTYSMSSHLLNFGFSFTQVNTWTTSVNGTQIIPGVNFGVVSTDPIISTNNIFTLANFPGATTADMQTNAPALYALLTGRVSSINRSVVLDDETKTYGPNQPIVKNQQREFGLYFQDSWRVKPGLTLNYGVRWDLQNPPVNLNGVYTRPGYAGVWGISGIGNLFKPGASGGQTPFFNATTPGEAGYEINHKQFSPSIGLAWQMPKSDGPLSWLIGKSGSVLRAGYAISTLREDASTLAVWGGNQGRTITLNVDPTNFLADFGPAGSVQFRNAVLPKRQAPTTPSFPLAIQAGNSITDFDPHLKVGYVQSWDIGLQRELTRDTALEVRYVGNHGTRLWRQVNINEINALSNGFLEEFRVAQANLASARGCSTPDPVCMGINRAKSSNYSGLAGQAPLPMIQLAVGGTGNDATTALQIEQGQVGALANAIATNSARIGRLTAANYPANLFQVNPAAISGSANIEVNGGNSNYNGLQVELKRRMSKGLLFQGSYVWSHSITNESGAGVNGSFTTLRNMGYDKQASPYDIRQAVKMNWIYELPLGKGHHFLGGVSNPVTRKIVEGWQIASVTRVQTGSPIRLTSGRATYNQNESGVILHNMTVAQLQDMMKIRKVNVAATATSPAIGAVYYFPQALVDNTNAAFEVNNKKLTDLDRNAPYIGPADQPGQLGSRISLYGPRQQKWDFSLVKKTYLNEKGMNLEFRMNALNAFNLTNFLLFVPGNGITTTLGANGSGFGQTSGAYKDLSNTNDPGGRIVEFQLRLTF